jgi:gliding motility-associated-like protein
MKERLLIIFSKWMTVFFAGMFAINSSAQVIDSIKTTISTCPNNGSISVYAKGSNPPLLYSIVAGPVLQSTQTGNVFNSLPPGNYTVKVSDGLGNSISKNTTITGNYIPLDFNPLKTNPYCIGGNDGKIIGNRITNTGNGPFTWQLIAPSPVTTAPQSSDTFPNLPAGNYTMRLTDACNSFRTIVVTLSDPSNATINIVTAPRVEIINCNSAMVTFFMQSSLPRFPLTYKFETTNGTFITTTPTVQDTSNGSNYFTVQQLLPNFTYGNYLKITVTNTCNYSVSSDLGYARIFTFCPAYTAHFNNCTYLTQINFDINNPTCMAANNLFTGMSAPLTYSFTDAATNIIVDSGTIAGDPTHAWYNLVSGVMIKPVPGNKNYNLVLKDGCGNTFSKSYFVTAPVSPPPSITSKNIYKDACMDSAAFAFVFTDNFKTQPVLVLLSGPPVMGSTKPGYAYHDTYSYPDTIPISALGGTTYRFDIRNLSVGTYRFKVIDSCGSEVFDNLIIKPSQVTNFGEKFWYKKGCLGKNELHYTINSGNGYILIQNTSAGTSQYKYYQSQTASTIHDSIVNLSSGVYQISFTYQGYFGSGTPANHSTLTCQMITKTITIAGYETPEIHTSNSIMCHNKINIELLPDSSKGVPPYQYEIISGPQIFSVQNGNIFQATLPGTYTARIYDICGNASTKQIFVSNITFAPVEVKKNCNNVRLVYPSFIHYKYKWAKPNGTIYTGDSLSIAPVTPADTGVYSISKIVNINGCQDTVLSSYHLSLPNFYQQTIPFCKNTTIQVGTTIYNKPGIYKDTLTTIAGCDSIVVTNVVALPQKTDSTQVTICKGDHIIVNGHLYSLPGTYRDSIQNSSGCYDITITELKVNIIASLHLGNDTSICQSQQLKLNAGSGYSAYYWNNNTIDSLRQTLSVSLPGKYWVTVKNSIGCSATDTIELLQVYLSPSVNIEPDKNICAGESVELSISGGTNYLWSPLYSTEPNITVSPMTTSSYSVKIYDVHGCASSATITVYVHPLPEQPIFISNLLSHCFEEGSLILQPAWGNSFFWTSTGDTTSQLMVNQKGTYEVKVYDSHGCAVRGTVEVSEHCPPSIFVPGGFSPNGDGNNDDLEIFGKHFKNFEMKIFNRWGEIIFISTDRNKQWDGIYRGEPMPIGTYPWIISYQGEEEEKENTLKGSVTLIR